MQILCPLEWHRSFKIFCTYLSSRNHISLFFIFWSASIWGRCQSAPQFLIHNIALFHLENRKLGFFCLDYFSQPCMPGKHLFRLQYVSVSTSLSCLCSLNAKIRPSLFLLFPALYKCLYSQCAIIVNWLHICLIK